MPRLVLVEVQQRAVPGSAQLCRVPPIAFLFRVLKRFRRDGISMRMSDNE